MSRSFLKKLIVLIINNKFAIKVGIAGGSVYYLAEQGVWRESTESTKLYDKISAITDPWVKDLKKQLPIEIPDLPSRNKVSYVTKTFWNSTVTSSFDYLCKLPENASSWTQEGFNILETQAELKKYFQSLSTPAEAK